MAVQIGQERGVDAAEPACPGGQFDEALLARGDAEIADSAAVLQAPVAAGRPRREARPAPAAGSSAPVAGSVRCAIAARKVSARRLAEMPASRSRARSPSAEWPGNTATTRRSRSAASMRVGRCWGEGKRPARTSTPSKRAKDEVRATSGLAAWIASRFGNGKRLGGEHPGASLRRVELSQDAREKVSALGLGRRDPGDETAGSREERVEPLPLRFEPGGDLGGSEARFLQPDRDRDPGLSLGSRSRGPAALRRRSRRSTRARRGPRRGPLRATRSSSPRPPSSPWSRTARRREARLPRESARAPCSPRDRGGWRTPLR